MASGVGLYGLSWVGACRVISYDIGESGQTLIFEDKVLTHFARNRQRTARSLEAGGQLFARFEGDIIRIERATGPRATDRRGLLSFIPDRLAERREIKRFFKSGLHYVGDWHTHPEPRPQPSQTDIDSFQQTFRKSRHKLASFVMVIVGTSMANDGLFVGLCNNDGLMVLSLIEESRSIRGRNG